MQPDNEPAGPGILLAAGKRLGVEPQTVYRYTSGVRYPTLPVVRRIEEQFDWPIQDQIRLIPDAPARNLAYGTVLAEVLREHFPDIEQQGFGISPPKPRVVPRDPKAGGWTRASVGGLLEVAAGNVARWLNGIRYPELRMILKIARVLNWPAGEQIVLIPETGHNKAYATAFQAVLDREFPVLEEGVTKITSEIA